jgi:protein tyrosine phosphatase
MLPLSPLFLQSITTPKNTENYSRICDNLYIGNIDSLKDASKFSVIINCTKHIPFTTIPHITYIRVPVNDTPLENENILKYVKEFNVLNIIHESRLQGKNVLVHCHAGMQRSCAVVALYLIQYYKLTPERAIQIIKSKRAIAFYPEPTFQKALESYYQTTK